MYELESGEAMREQPAARPTNVPVHEPLDETAAALVNTALFDTHLPPPHADGVPVPIAVESEEVRRFLAWQIVQRGGRAGLVVGRLFDERQKVALPYTGFEGYFPIHLRRSDEVPAERVLQFEEAFGLLGEAARRRQDLDDLSPEQLVVEETARLGVRELDAIERICAAQPDPDTARRAFHQATRGSGLDPQYGMLAVEELAAFLGETIARLKAFTEEYRDALDAFRNETYAQIVPGLSYTVERGGYWRSYTLVQHPPAERLTTVRLSERELAGYTFMAGVGAFGDPLLRAALRLSQQL